MTQAANMFPSVLQKPAGEHRSALGWSISMLVHATIITWLWHASPHRSASIDTQPQRRMAVWLVAEPAPVPLPAIVAPAAVARMPALPGPGRTVRRPRFSAMPAMPALPQSPAVVATTAAPALQNEPAKPGGDAATFDMAAARSSARATTREDRTGMAALALRPEATGARTSEQIQQRLEQARRGNCLKANDSMNLLANVVMLARDIAATAVDSSGCKW